MKWRPAKHKDGWTFPGVRESDEGYLIACVGMGREADSPPYCYTLAAPGRLIEVIRDVPAEVDARRKAYSQLQELAEADFKARTPQSSPAG